MDCKKVKEEMVFLVGDRDLGHELVVAFERHLSHCPECARKAQSTQMLLTFVRQCMPRRCAPTRLKVRILDRLQNGSLP